MTEDSTSELEEDIRFLRAVSGLTAKQQRDLLDYMVRLADDQVLGERLGEPTADALSRSLEGYGLQ